MNFLKIRSLLLIPTLLVACSHPQPKATKNSREDRQYKGVNFHKLYQKDRSYESLNNDLTMISDRILTWSGKNWSLNPQENRMIEEYVRQNKLFSEPGFDKAWLEKTRIMFDRILNEEQNMIAPAIYQKFEDLYNETK